MKAAVLYSNDTAPQYTDYPEPIPQNDQELLVTVKAVALKHFDKSRAKGAHYSSEKSTQEAKVIGGDGVCVLPDGSRAYAIGASGMMAEKATVEKDRIVPLPEGISDEVAAALPNAVFGAAMALRFRAAIEPGDTVLVNGATGFTGRIAVQLAKHYGAGRVIATGRNPQSLQELPALGADQVLSTDIPAEAFTEQLRSIHRATPINIVIDYLWGNTAECILASLKGMGSFTPRTRYVSVGAMTGDQIQLSASSLRSIDLQLTGSGLGSWTKPQVRLLFTEILPEMFHLAATGRLQVPITSVPLSDIQNLWDLHVPGGTRLVVQI